jgi:hypothetical protein
MIALVALRPVCTLCALGALRALGSSRALSSRGSLRTCGSTGTRGSHRSSDARRTRRTGHARGTRRSGDTRAHASRSGGSRNSGQPLRALRAWRSDLIPCDMGLCSRAVDRALDDAYSAGGVVVAPVHEPVEIRDQTARRGDERAPAKSERQRRDEPVADRPLDGALPQRSCEMRCEVEHATDGLSHNARGLERLREQVRKTEANRSITETARPARARYEIAGSAVGSAERSITPTPGTV